MRPRPPAAPPCRACQRRPHRRHRRRPRPRRRPRRQPCTRHRRIPSYSSLRHTRRLRRCSTRPPRRCTRRRPHRRRPRRRRRRRYRRLARSRTPRSRGRRGRAGHRALEPAVAPLRARQPSRRNDAVTASSGLVDGVAPHAALLSARGLVVARRARRAAVGGDVFKHGLVLEPLRRVAHRRDGVAAHPPACPVRLGFRCPR